MAQAVKKAATSLSTFRSIVSELKKANKDFRNSEQYKYLMEQMRNNQVTTQRYSKSADEAESVANLYLTYIRSNNKLNELQERYKGGERSVEESARLVGLQLPKRK